MGAVLTKHILEAVPRTIIVGEGENRVSLSVAISNEFHRDPMPKFLFILNVQRIIGHLHAAEGKLSLYFEPSRFDEIFVKAIALAAFVYEEACRIPSITAAKYSDLEFEIQFHNTKMQWIMLSLLLICRGIGATRTDQLTGNGMSTIEASDVKYKIPSYVVQQWVMHLHAQMAEYLRVHLGLQTAWSSFRFLKADGSRLEEDVRHRNDFAANLDYLLRVAGKPALQVYFFQTTLRDRLNHEMRSAPPQINTEHFEATARLGPQQLFQENINSSTECTFAAKKLSPKERKERNLDVAESRHIYEVTMTPRSDSAMPADLPRRTYVFVRNAARTRQTAAWPVMGAPIVPPLQSVVVGHPVKEPIRPPLSGNPQQVCPIGPKAHAKGDVQLNQNARPLNPPCARTDGFTRTMQGKHSFLPGKNSPMPIDEELAKHIKEALPEVDASRVYKYCNKFQENEVQCAEEMTRLTYKSMCNLLGLDHSAAQDHARRIYMVSNAKTKIDEDLTHHIREALKKTDIDEATAHCYSLIFQKELGVTSLEQLKQEHERTSDLGIPMLHLTMILVPDDPTPVAPAAVASDLDDTQSIELSRSGMEQDGPITAVKGADVGQRVPKMPPLIPPDTIGQLGPATVDEEQLSEPRTPDPTVAYYLPTGQPPAATFGAIGQKKNQCEEEPANWSAFGGAW